MKGVPFTPMLISDIKGYLNMSLLSVSPYFFFYFPRTSSKNSLVSTSSPSFTLPSTPQNKQTEMTDGWTRSHPETDQQCYTVSENRCGTSIMVFTIAQWQEWNWRRQGRGSRKNWKKLVLSRLPLLEAHKQTKTRLDVYRTPVESLVMSTALLHQVLVTSAADYTANIDPPPTQR